MRWNQRLLGLQILGVVVGGVLRVHLLFPHFAHEAGRKPAVQGRRHFGFSKSRSLLPLPFRRRRRRLPRRLLLPLLHLPTGTRRRPPPPPPPSALPPPSFSSSSFQADRKTLQSAEDTPDRALPRSFLWEPDCARAAKGWRADRAALREQAEPS